MVEPDAPHAGIELDVICLSTVSQEAAGSDAAETVTDPGDYKVFVNSIFKKMKAHDSFLSFSGQITNVNKILTMKYSSASDIARVILKDMALTAKVLKLVNSSFYRHFSTKGISTISEAMIILGTEEVRLAAASLKIYEMMRELTQTGILKDMTLKGLQRSIMARQMAKDSGHREVDAVQVAAMVYDLGEYLVALFAPDKYINISLASEEEGLTVQEASRSILGITYNDLGRIVSLKLHLPENVVNTMRPVTRFDAKRDQLSLADFQRYICFFTKEICDIPRDMDGSDREARVIRIAERYKDILGIDRPTANELLNESWERTLQHAAALKVDPVQSRDMAAKNGVKDQGRLDKGLEEIRRNLDSNLSIHEIFSNMVKTLHKSFFFSNVLICIKNKEVGTMNARFAEGENARQLLDGFKFAIRDNGDVFNLAIQRDAHLVVRDTRSGKYKGKIPGWFMEKKFSDKFMTLPVYVDGKIISMLYVDWTSGGVGQKTIDYLYIFKDLMIRAFTQHKRK